MSVKPLIYDFSLPEIEDFVHNLGEPTYRARQIWQGLYQSFWNKTEQFTNLPANLRLELSQNFSFTHLEPVKNLESSDGQTRKTLFHLPDNQSVEAVLMYYGQGDLNDISDIHLPHHTARRTLCISTQAGCAMGCVFCATGQMGFRRNLTSGEIIEEVLYYARQLRASNEHVTNVVIMGMGEPFHNYNATLDAIDRLNQPDGFNFGARRFTISTVGLVPAIKRFAAEKRQVNLAVSLHAADNELRSSLLPVNKKYPLEELFSACKEYVQLTHRRITFEWALIQGVNDTLEQAQKLIKHLSIFIENGASLCHVNIIPLNPTHRYNGQATSRQQALLFQAELERNGIPCTIRLRRGIDIQAGCGQLAIEDN
jgi:23S rRNA (adenine2503-C2)-methyltransferase